MLVIHMNDFILPKNIRIVEEKEGGLEVIYNVKESDRLFKIDEDNKYYYLVDVPQSSRGLVQEYDMCPGRDGGWKNWTGIDYTYGAVEKKDYEDSYIKNKTADFLIEAYKRGEFEKYEYIIEESLEHLMTANEPAARLWEKWGELFEMTGKTATDYVEPELAERYLGFLKSEPRMLTKTGKQLGDVKGLEDELEKAQKIVDIEDKNLKETGTIFSAEFTEKVNQALVEMIKNGGEGFSMKCGDHVHYDIEVEGETYHGKLADENYSEDYYDDYYDEEEENVNDEIKAKYPYSPFYTVIWIGEDYFTKGQYGEATDPKTGYYTVQLTKDTVEFLEEWEKNSNMFYGPYDDYYDDEEYDNEEYDDEEYDDEIPEENDNSEKTELQKKEEELSSLETEEKTISEVEDLIDQQEKNEKSIGE